MMGSFLWVKYDVIVVAQMSQKSHGVLIKLPSNSLLDCHNC